LGKSRVGGSQPDAEVKDTPRPGPQISLQNPLKNAGKRRRGRDDTQSPTCQTHGGPKGKGPRGKATIGADP